MFFDEIKPIFWVFGFVVYVIVCLWCVWKPADQSYDVWTWQLFVGQLYAIPALLLTVVGLGFIRYRFYM